jgi:hypothetical protein
VESRFGEVQGIDFSSSREENQRLESTSMWIRGDRQITETTGKNCVSLALMFIYLLIIFLRN